MRDRVQALLDQKKSTRDQESLKEVREEEASDDGEDEIREDEDEEDMVEADEEREADNQDALKLFDDETAHIVPRTNKTMTGAAKIVDDFPNDYSMADDSAPNDGLSDVEQLAGDATAAADGQSIEDRLAEHPELRQMILQEIDHFYAQSLEHSLEAPARGRRRKNPQSVGRRPQDEAPSFPANDSPRPPRPVSHPAPRPVSRPGPYPSPHSLVARTASRFPTQRVRSDSEVDGHQFADPDDPIFLRHTKIMVVQHGRRYYLTKRDQGSEIERVLRRAIRIITRCMGINPENPDFVPFNQDQLEALCLDSLLAASAELGYAGVGDIRDRLINGDMETYVRPMRAYVQQRAILLRSDVKKIAAAIVPGFFDLSKTDAGRRKAKDLLENMSYAFGANATGQPDRSKPLGCSVLGRLISPAYSSVLVKHADKLSSTVAEGPQSKELEVTPLMVAMSATAVHAVISELAHNTKEEFSGTNLENTFKMHLAMLKGLRERRAAYYHKLMHDLYISSTGAIPNATHGLSTEEILGAIDWDAIV